MGVNQIRNRGYWHVAVWDEYGQKLQYMAMVPTMLIMFPSYYIGCWLNRDLESNMASKMYALDYETRRNRLTYSMIFEHFEKHTEQVQDMIDEMNLVGFEKYFENELETMGEGEEPEISSLHGKTVNRNYYLEMLEYTGTTARRENLVNRQGVNFWLRNAYEGAVGKREYPGSEYTEILKDNAHYFNTVKHAEIDLNNDVIIPKEEEDE